MKNLREWQQIVERERTQYWVIPPRGLGGGTVTQPLPWVGMTVQGGNTLITTPARVYGIKRKAGEAKAAAWINMPRTAKATATISGGSVNTLTVGTPGLGYTIVPAVTVTPAPGGGTNAVVTATVNANGGTVEAAYLTNVGANYTAATVAFAAPGSGVTATGTCVLRDGMIVGITITNKGRGYTAVPAITITGTGGAGAAATAIIGQGYIILAITNPGSGYLVAPTITVAAPPAQPIPLPPTPALPGGTSYADGIGWGIIQGGSLTGGLAASQPALICHDDRSMVAYGLMGQGGVTPFSRAPDSVLSWYQTYVRLSIADPLADGILPCWVPMSGGL